MMICELGEQPGSPERDHRLIPLGGPISEAGCEQESLYVLRQAAAVRMLLRLFGFGILAPEIGARKMQ